MTGWQNDEATTRQNDEKPSRLSFMLQYASPAGRLHGKLTCGYQTKGVVVGNITNQQREDLDTTSFKDFESASKAVLSLLRDRLGFDLWMITRTEGEDWIVLHSEDHGYGVAPGTVFRWTDSFCYQMVQGQGPRIAPRSKDVPAYAAAPIGRQVDISAYIGQPLVLEDGSLFGTLCAIDPSPKSDTIEAEQGLLELLTGLLSSILQSELRAEREARRLERLEDEALTDYLTGLYNRRAWSHQLESEEERCRRFGHPAAVIVIDLDELKLINDTQGHSAGDAVLVHAAAVLRNFTRSADLIARLGGDEFGILSPECDEHDGEALLARLRAAFAEAEIKASMGLAARQPSAGLVAAWESADGRMYEEKRSR